MQSRSGEKRAKRKGQEHKKGQETTGKRRDSMGQKQTELTVFGEEIKRTSKLFC